LRTGPVALVWLPPEKHRSSQTGTDGVVTQMIDGNAYGMNTPGRYDPELIAHYARGRREHADELPVTVKIAALCGRYMIDEHDGAYYAIVGRHFDDAMCLRVAHAYEIAVGGFPVPPAFTPPGLCRRARTDGRRS
jgi:hypothetical protein